MTLLTKNILNVPDWDKQVSAMIRDAPGNLQEKVVQFLTQFIQAWAINKQLPCMSIDTIPCLLKEAKALTLGQDT